MRHTVCLNEQVVAGNIGHQDVQQLEAQAGAVDLQGTGKGQCSARGSYSVSNDTGAC